MARSAAQSAQSPKHAHAFDFMDGQVKIAAQGVVAVYGPDRFLRREIIRKLSDHWLGEEAEFPLTRLPGKEVIWRDVHDHLSTPSLFGPPVCAVVIDDADEFIKKSRASLESFGESRPTRSVLVLDVDSWPGNTRIFRIVQEHGFAIRCAPPETGTRGQVDHGRFVKWVEQWGRSHHRVELQKGAANLLVELAGLDCGRLDQELAKLAVWGDGSGQVSAKDVQNAVGGWRTQTTWDLIDAACQGDAKQALLLLDRLLQAGEVEIAIFGSMSWSLRRFAAVTRRVQEQERRGQKAKLGEVLAQAGFKNWPVGALDRSMEQLLQIGRKRGAKLYRRLLETDMALKGSHSQPGRARSALELLILELAQPFR